MCVCARVCVCVGAHACACARHRMPLRVLPTAPGSSRCACAELLPPERGVATRCVATPAPRCNARARCCNAVAPRRNKPRRVAARLCAAGLSRTLERSCSSSSQPIRFVMSTSTEYALVSIPAQPRRPPKPPPSPCGAKQVSACFMLPVAQYRTVPYSTEPRSTGVGHRQGQGASIEPLRIYSRASANESPAGPCCGRAGGQAGGGVAF